MYYLRVVRNHASFTPAGFDLAKASAQIADRLGGRASVFAVTDEADAVHIAVLYAMLTKPGPEQLDFVLISETWLAEFGLAAAPEPDDIAHRLLRQRHHELHGLDRPSVCEQLAGKFQQASGIAKRLNPKAVTLLAKAELEADPVNAAALIAGKQRWHDRIQQAR